MAALPASWPQQSPRVSCCSFPPAESNWRRRINPWCVHRPESSLSLVVLAAVVIDAQERIELLAGKQVIVWRRTGLREQVAEGIVVVGIGNGPGGVHQEAHRAVAVIAAEAGLGRPAKRLALIDEN